MNKLMLLWAALLCASNFTYSQSIPNSGFETWNNPNGYNVPDGWSTFNDITSPMSIYTCSKGVPGSPGSSYIKLVSKSVPGLGVVPGMAVSGAASFENEQIIGGFPCTVLPTALTGKWQYMGGSAADIGYISIVFTKWNSEMNMRDTIGDGQVDLDGMEMSWSNFSIPISYDSADLPDSCTIQMSASGMNPVANSYLYVDNLNFAGVVVGTFESAITKNIVTYPNPCNDNLSLSMPNSIFESNTIISLVDELGKIVWSKSNNFTTQMNIPTAQLPAGVYFLRISNDQLTYHTKIIKS